MFNSYASMNASFDKTKTSKSLNKYSTLSKYNSGSVNRVFGEQMAILLRGQKVKCFVDQQKAIIGLNCKTFTKSAGDNAA